MRVMVGADQFLGVLKAYKTHENQDRAANHGKRITGWANHEKRTTASVAGLPASCREAAALKNDTQITSVGTAVIYIPF